MTSRLPLAGLLILALAGCRGVSTPAADAGAVVFVDAAGNRMTVDVPSRTPAANPELPPPLPVGPVPAAPEAVTAPAFAPAPAAPGGESAPVAATPGADGAAQFGGEQFIDVDAFEQAAEDRERDRFYTIPLPEGGRGVVSAEAIGATGSPGAQPRDVPAARPLAALRACPTGVRIAWLRPMEERAGRQELAFPVLSSSYEDTRRYAGYELPLPAGTRALDVWALARRGAPPDVVVALLDATGQVTAVVNNIATESIPETLFSYARVGSRIPVPPILARGGRVAVLEGTWARKTLPAGCAPGEPSGAAVAGHVTVEYLLGD